eukprot:11117785-Ditylum_brightwellii.AAC.1
MEGCLYYGGTPQEVITGLKMRPTIVGVNYKHNIWGQSLDVLDHAIKNPTEIPRWVAGLSLLSYSKKEMNLLLRTTTLYVVCPPSE